MIVLIFIICIILLNVSYIKTEIIYQDVSSFYEANDYSFLPRNDDKKNKISLFFPNSQEENNIYEMEKKAIYCYSTNPIDHYIIPNFVALELSFSDENYYNSFIENEYERNRYFEDNFMFFLNGYNYLLLDDYSITHITCAGTIERGGFFCFSSESKIIRFCLVFESDFCVLEKLSIELEKVFYYEM